MNNFEMALKLKNDGKYFEAIKHLGLSLNKNKYNNEIYYSLGKIYYLLDDKMASVKNYLISLHLNLLETYQNSKINGADILIKDIDHNILQNMNNISPLVKYTVIKKNILVHIAHSLADFENNSILNNRFIENYKNRLMGVDIPSSKKEMELENNFYYILGIDFAINALKYELKKQEVVTIYYSDNEIQYMNIYNKIIDKIF